MTTPEETKKALEPSKYPDIGGVEASLIKLIGEFVGSGEGQARAVIGILTACGYTVEKENAALSQPAQGDANKLSKRIEAAIKRLGDAKAIHSRWYEMPKYEADRYAADNMNEIEQIIYSAICYLEGHKGLYLKPEAQSPAPQPDTGAEIEENIMDALEEFNEEVNRHSRNSSELFSDTTIKTIIKALTARNGVAQSVDVEALKMNKTVADLDTPFDHGYMAGYNAAIDHLVAAGHLKAQHPDVGALVEALRFYADKKNYTPLGVATFQLKEHGRFPDHGKTARTAMSKWEGK